MKSTVSQPLCSVLLILTACTGGSDTESASDSGPPEALIDAAEPNVVDAAVPVQPDAAPTESCTSDWCSLVDAPSWGWGLSVTPSGQPWVVAYGAHVLKSFGWFRYEPTWADFTSPFIVHGDMHVVRAFASNDVWVGGAQGYVGHWNGITWTEHRPVAPSAMGIWGAAPDDVWFLYDTGLRYRWNGSELISAGGSSIKFRGSWGSSESDVWGYGRTTEYLPALDHWDGAGWQTEILPGSGTIISFWAAGPQSRWAVRYGSVEDVLLHDNGQGWSEVSLPANTGVLAVWGRSASDIYVVGRAGKIFHYNGTSWTNSPSGTTTTLEEIDGNDSAIWVVGKEVALRKN